MEEMEELKMESSSTAPDSSDSLILNCLQIGIGLPFLGSKKKQVCILTPDELKQKLMPILERMYKQEPECIPFKQPVDPVLFCIPDYFDIIKKPIDLSVIKRKLDHNQYQHLWEFLNDVRLMFDNAWLYNKISSRVYGYCTKLSAFFEEEIHPVTMSMGYCCGRECYCYPNTTKQENRGKKRKYSETEEKLIVESSSAAAGSKSNDLPIAAVLPVPRPQPEQICKFTPRELRKKLMPNFKLLYQKVPESYPFRQPVDPIALGIPDYFKIITSPMDLSLIKRKLDLGYYKDVGDYIDDVSVMLSNVWKYNRKSSRVYRYAKKLAAVFEQDLQSRMESILYPV